MFFAIISILASVGTTVYGGRLYLILKDFPIESVGRKAKQREVGVTVIICALAFLFQAALLLVFTFKPVEDLNPYFIGGFYLAVEIVPTAAILYILRKLPPRRDSNFAPFRAHSLSSSQEDYHFSSPKNVGVN
jgi:hypothetical protein